MQFGDNDVKSAYNEGVFQIQRLHFLWIEANNQSRSGELKKWHWTLNVIWRELTRDAIRKMNDKSKPEDFQKLSIDNPYFKEYKRLERAIADSNTKKDFGGAYLSLGELEIFLRHLQDVVGKGGKYKRGDDDDLD